MDRHTAGGRIDQFRLYLLAERGRSPHTAESYASDLRQWLQFCDCLLYTSDAADD
ncbi:site-specific integrase [uncultured Fretibacterium sp.]|uniref:site-specific integrase n=1 Tax=uncultured Fretibacterium sp. TaxID=1678694 RepID=UPI00325F95DA